MLSARNRARAAPARPDRHTSGKGILAGLGYWAFAALASDLTHALGDLPQLLHKVLVELFGDERIHIFGRTFDAGAVTGQMMDGLFIAFGQPQQWLAGTIIGFAVIAAVVLVVVLIFYFLSDGPQITAGVLLAGPARVPRRGDGGHRQDRPDAAALPGGAARHCHLRHHSILDRDPVRAASSVRIGAGVADRTARAHPPGGSGDLRRHHRSAVAGAARALGDHRFCGIRDAVPARYDRFIGPWVLGRAAQIHPVVVMFALIAGWLFLGVPGVLLAVPVAASIKIVLEHYYSHPMRGRRRG